jgi:hypothetical protein
VSHVQSILNSIKKILGIAEDYTAYDVDIVIHINSVFARLHQLGIGPDEGFSIEDDTTTWDTFLEDDPRLNNVKTYMYLRVRMLFDPPTTSYAVQAATEQIAEYEYLINTYREGYAWVDPSPAVPSEL